MKHILVLIICLSTVLQISAQTQQGIDDVDVNQLKKEQKTFESTFQKELNNMEEPSAKDYLDTRPAELPENTIDRTARTGQIMGISDPCMDKGRAIETARLRAIALMGLSRKVKVRYMAEYYTNQNQAGTGDYSTQAKWEEYGKLQSALYYDSSQVAVTDTHVTKYDEALVTLEPMINDQAARVTDTMTITANVYHREEQADNNTENMWKLSVNMERTSCDDHRTWSNDYTVKQAGRNTATHSSYNQQRHDICDQYYHYRVQQQTDTTTLQHAHTLTNGLWAGYINATMRAITNKANEEAERIKTLGELYQQNYEDLSRSVMKGAYSFEQKSLRIKDNRLVLTTVLTEQQ